MAAIFQLRRGSGSLSLVDGELYVNKGPDSLQYAVGEREITLAKLDELNTGSLYLKGGISASGDITASNLYVSGNVVLGGTITIGDTTSDNLVVNADLSSSIIPNNDNAFDLGSASFRYRNIYATSITGAIAATNGVVSGSAQVVGILSSLNSFSASNGNTSLNSYTGSNDTTNTTQNTRLSRLEESTSSLNAFSASENSKSETLRLYTASVDTKFSTLQTLTASMAAQVARLQESTASLNAFSASVNGHISDINTKTGSFETKFNTLQTLTGSFETTGRGIISSSAQLSGTTITNLTITNLTTVNETASVIFSSGSNRFGDFGDDIHSFTGSVKISGSIVTIGSLTATSYNGIINATNGVVSGSSQVIALLPIGTISGSAQITSLGFISSSTTPTGTISGSAQITALGFISSSQTINTGSFATTGSNSFNESQQITGSLLVSQNITGSASASFVSLAVNTTTPAQKIHLKGIVGIEAGTTGGNTADQMVFGYLNSGLTQFTHKIQTGHDAQAHLNRMDFLIANSSNTWKTPLQLRPDIINISASVSVTGSLTSNGLGVLSGSAQITAFGFISSSTTPTGTISGSAQITSLGFVSSSITASSLVTASVSVNVITFTKGNGSTFDLTIAASGTAPAGTVSSSAQIIQNLPNGVVSGSSQITYANISSIPSGIVSGSTQTIANLPTGTVSGSSQVVSILSSLNTYTGSNDTTNTAQNTRLTTIESVTGSYETKGRGIVSGSSQITPLLPIGVVSGSSQITYASISSIPANIVSGSSQITYTSISSIPGGIVSGSSQVLGSSTIHSGSSGNYQFNSIGVGTAASAVAGEIRATNDITAFYSSDIRLKENIQPIQNALEKVESISGNTYDWKEGYEEIHSHKGNDVGVIAQEIEAVLPQLVVNRDNGYKAVQYEKIIPLLIEAIKELSNKIDRLENK